METRAKKTKNLSLRVEKSLKTTEKIRVKVSLEEVEALEVGSKETNEIGF